MKIKIVNDTEQVNNMSILIVKKFYTYTIF